MCSQGNSREHDRRRTTVPGRSSIRGPRQTVRGCLQVTAGTDAESPCAEGSDQGRNLLAKNALAPHRLQRGHLSSGVLIVGGNAGETDQHCIRVLQNQCVLQYRFATPKPLKTRPGPDRCKTVPFCNPFSPRLQGSQIGLRRQGSASPLRALDSSGPIRRGTLFTREKGGGWAALTCFSVEAISEFFGVLVSWLVFHSSRRSYYLFFTTCSLLLVLYYLSMCSLSPEDRGSMCSLSPETDPFNVFAFTVENCPGSQRSVENPGPNGPEARDHCSPDRSQQRARIGRE